MVRRAGCESVVLVTAGGDGARERGDRGRRLSRVEVQHISMVVVH